VVVAVIDTGVDYNHQDLSANIWTNPGEIPGNGLDDDGNGFIDDVRGWDFNGNDNDPFDDNSHGTHVAGTIAAVGNNEYGVVGVNWTAQIMPIKFINANGSGTVADAIEAIQYATMMGARITNNSWGGAGFSQALKDAIVAADAAGVLFVAAAGNDGENNDILPFYPASFDVPNIIGAAATDHFDDLAGFSNYGSSSVDLGAPGVDILSTIPNDEYDYKSGTSMATPHVSGVAALIMAEFPALTHDEIKERMLNAVDPLLSLKELVSTGGRLNANNALLGVISITALAKTPPGSYQNHRVQYG
jgi:subtilisin family serine protease